MSILLKIWIFRIFHALVIIVVLFSYWKQKDNTFVLLLVQKYCFGEVFINFKVKGHLIRIRKYRV